MRDKEGSSTVTYRLQLHYKNIEWLIKTKELYNDVMLFYYQLLLEHRELLERSNQKILRELEILSIAPRKNTESKEVSDNNLNYIVSDMPKYPIPYVKVPLYLRRAAINGAIGLVRTYNTKYMAWSESVSLEKTESLNEIERPKVIDEFEKFKTIKQFEKPEVANRFHAQPVFYKGMYKEFLEDSILLKLWTGKSWVWVKHKLSGRGIPKESEILSPTLAINHNKVMLHVPVKSKVSDIRTVKERVEDKERICSVSLSSSDTLAVCTVMESDGSVVDSVFIRGGDELKHRRKRLSGRIARNQRLTGGIQKGVKNNTMLYEKIKNITDYYSHLVSRRIIDFCEKHEVKIIVFQNIEKVVPITNRFVDVSVNDFIIQRVVKYVGYKAFAQGMVVTTVRPHYTSCKCYKCRAYVRKYSKKECREEIGKEVSDNNLNYIDSDMPTAVDIPESKSSTNYLTVPKDSQTMDRNAKDDRLSKHYKKDSYGKYFICENGHQGNAYLNTSKNIGLMFIKKARVVNSGVVNSGVVNSEIIESGIINAEFIKTG